MDIRREGQSNPKRPLGAQKKATRAFVLGNYMTYRQTDKETNQPPDQQSEVRVHKDYTKR